MRAMTWIVAGLIMVTILVVAAFTAGRLLRPAVAAQSGRDEPTLELPVEGANGTVMARFRIEPAPELPDGPSVAGGVVVRRENDSFFVGTGNVRLNGEEVDPATGRRAPRLGHDGPVVEIVVTGDTIIYRDETIAAAQERASATEGEQRIRQTLDRADSLEAVGPNAVVTVWGERRGDRIVAQVLVYQELPLVQ